MKSDDQPASTVLKPGSDRPESVVTTRPMPVNQRFRTLEDYLAFRKSRSAIDGSWYREIRPGIYRLETGNYRPAGGGDRKRIFTRAELAKKFGFGE